MPTAYTAPVADGEITTLRDFAVRCARGMGATIMMRDDPLDAPIPERFEPSSYHAERLTEAKAKLAELEVMTPIQRARAAEAWNQDNNAANEKVLAENTERRNRYNAMIAKVVEWEGAPEGLKEFMLEQLHTGRDFDCPYDPLKYRPTPRSTDEWYTTALEDAKWQVEYHAGEYQEEVERTEGRNAWLAQLRVSLAAEGRSS